MQVGFSKGQSWHLNTSLQALKDAKAFPDGERQGQFVQKQTLSKAMLEYIACQRKAFQKIPPWKQAAASTREGSHV